MEATYIKEVLDNDGTVYSVEFRCKDCYERGLTGRYAYWYVDYRETMPSDFSTDYNTYCMGCDKLLHGRWMRNTSVARMTKVQLLTEPGRPVVEVVKARKPFVFEHETKGLVWLYTTEEYPLDMYFGLNRRDFRVIHEEGE